MKYILKLLVGVLNLIFAVFKLLPVQNKVTFISRQADEKTEDIQMLGEELSCTASDLKLVFLCRRLDGGIGRKIGYCFHMLTQMYHIATSKVVILDSYCICVSVLKQRDSLTVIQMWHALGALKKFGLSITGEGGEGRNADIAEIMAMHKNYTYVLTSGRACLPHFAEAFGYTEETMRVMSLPRVDKLTDPVMKAEALEHIYAHYPEFREKKVVVYVPTFRKDKDISAEIDALAKQFDKGYVFVLKKHPLMEVSCMGNSAAADAGIAAFDATFIIDNEFTTLEMMFAADYVICDYSAVVYEAAIMKKPLFFYTFDYDSYGVDRDFYIDYRAEMPGVQSEDPQELAAAVMAEQYDLVRVADFAQRYVEHQSGCTAQLAEFILNCCR